MPSSRRTQERAFAANLRVRVPRLRSIHEVVRIMEAIQALVGRQDGVWWFTELYRRVTVSVDEACETRFFRYPEWMRCLVIEFAKLYFEALESWLAGRYRECPPAWRVLFSRRLLLRKRGYSPLQFALAGVNAHIQRDLAFAAIRATKQYAGGKLSMDQVRGDYTRVNRILEQVEVDAMRIMATGWIRALADRVHPLDRFAAMQMIRVARAIAFQVGKAQLSLEGRAPRFAKALQTGVEWYAWFWGRVLLLPTYADGESGHMI